MSRTNVNESRVLRALKTWKKPYPPSIRDIMEIGHIASSFTVWYNLRRLRKQGVVDFEDGKSRTVRLT